jgi:putative DNA primase/helicase
MTSIDVKPSGIPDELKGRKSWVDWRNESRDGKPTKVPYQTCGAKLAESNDPATWGTFGDALATYHAGGFDGIGIELGNGLAGIDLDGCRNPETGEIDDWAREVIARFPSYAEVSPSGTGVKILVYGTFPTDKTGAKTGKRNKPNGTGYGGKEPGIEAYHRGRYFAITGHGLETAPQNVKEFNGELSEWFTNTFAIQPKPKPSKSTGRRHVDEKQVFRRAIQYLEKCDPAISGQRGHDAAYHVACVLRCEFGLSLDDSLSAIQDWNSRCEPPWTEAELRKKLTDAEQEPVTNRLRDADNQNGSGRSSPKPKREEGGELPPTCDLSDLGNARLLVELHGNEIRYCHVWKKWLVWDGKRWRIDDTGAVERLAKHVADERWRTAQETGDKEFREFAADSASSKYITAMLKLAQSEPGIPVLPNELDRNPWLLNCNNGVVDLRTGLREKHRREDLITKLCPTEFDPDAASYDFDRFMEAIFKGEQALIDFLQRLFGYGVTGDVREQILAILWGGGSNGKSTLLNAVMDAVGTDYCLKAVADLLMVKHNESHPTERADLFGMRMVVCTETADGRGMNEALVKELTGGDKVRARRMREDFWEFDPTHKPILCTNHKPKVRGNDHAIWRRLVLVPFEVQFWNPDKGESGADELRQDKGLPAKLKREAAGILAWLVRGCLEWQRTGLRIPEAVRTATTNYRDEHDMVEMFIADRCIKSPMCRVRYSELYAAHQAWCEALGERAVSLRAFGEAITEKGYEKKESGGIWYLGIGLQADSQHSQQSS